MRIKKILGIIARENSTNLFEINSDWKRLWDKSLKLTKPEPFFSNFVIKAKTKTFKTKTKIYLSQVLNGTFLSKIAYC